jgi:hypothetical protein
VEKISVGGFQASHKTREKRLLARSYWLENMRKKNAEKEEIGELLLQLNLHS